MLWFFVRREGWRKMQHRPPTNKAEVALTVDLSPTVNCGILSIAESEAELTRFVARPVLVAAQLPALRLEPGSNPRYHRRAASEQPRLEMVACKAKQNLKRAIHVGELHQSTALLALARVLGIPMGMPAPLASTRASVSWHISSDRIAHSRQKKKENAQNA
jgi:hypothetical protein